ncbi:MAG: hypothetical protein AAF828_05360 [Bacteroidota bacterium]
MFKSKQFLGFTLSVLFLALTISSCNREDALESISPTVQVDNRMENALRGAVSQTDTTDQDIECFNFNFPIQIRLEDGTTQTANDLAELITISEALDSSEVDADFVYPFTITLEDGSMLTINDFDAFDEVLERCYWEDDDWEDDEDDDCYGDYDEVEDCFELVYPVTFLLPDSTSTATINSEEELEAFLDGLDEEALEDIDFVFPITIFSYLDSAEVIINNYDELDEVLETCYEDYDDDDDYDEEDLFDLSDCLTPVYPLSFILEDGTTISVADEAALIELLDSEEDIEDIVYPFSVTLTADDSTLTVNNEEELDELLEACDD